VIPAITQDKQEKRPTTMQYRTRKLVKPADLNGENTLFGGRLMEWLDEECAIYAICQLESTSLRTKLIGEIDFKAPAHQGEVIEIGVEAIKFGTTSLTMCAEVRNKTTKQVILTINKIVMVMVDQNGKSTPHGKTAVKTEVN
jgi:acyl-CoA hydrolase